MKKMKKKTLEYGAGEIHNKFIYHLEAAIYIPEKYL